MGCDIHAYIEYCKTGDDRWWNFGGRINPGRDYDVFAALAGVRNYDDKVCPKPKGLPLDVGWSTEANNRMYIAEEECEGCVTLERATQWVAAGYSEILARDGKPYAVTNPDWHSHSWATVEEWEAIAQLGRPAYRAMLAAMKSLIADGHKVRVVYWFDN